MYVQFEDQRNPQRPTQEISTYAQFLMNIGIAKTPGQANKILLVLALVSLLVAYFLWHSLNVSDNPANGRSVAELEQAGSPSEIAE